MDDTYHLLDSQKKNETQTHRKQDGEMTEAHINAYGKEKFKADKGGAN